ncbi:MAG: magnesium/cobalt transporter CorA [Dehalococcoidia bacterium]|nr:magnesium/cobalt transporter CorA [Dehalococcoidia bacterium]
MITSLYIDEQGKLTSNIPKEEYAGIIASGRGVLWVDMESPKQVEAVEVLTSIFKFHPLSVEDCFHPLQYSRVDVYRDYVFVIAHGLKSNREQRVKTVELDFYVGANYLVTFRDEPMAAVEALTQTVVKDSSRIARGADWLAHALLDALVDGYLPVIEAMEDRLETLEVAALENPGRETLADVLAAKRDVGRVHRAALPLREVISRISREELAQIKPATRVYFRDVYDHLVRVTEASEVMREVAEGALTIYAMSQNNRTNDVIKALSILATVALPALLVSSIYGMNFTHMPELDWRYGYLYALLTTGGISGSLLLILKYKKWL